MNSQSTENSNNNKPKETIGFWDFIYQEGDLVENYERNAEDYLRLSPFPKTIIEDNHFNFYSEKLGQRMKIYENSPCFGFLEKFYDYFKQAYKADKMEEYDEKFHYARASLQLFTFCYEKNMKKESAQKAALNENANANLL